MSNFPGSIYSASLSQAYPAGISPQLQQEAERSLPLKHLLDRLKYIEDGGRISPEELPGLMESIRMNAHHLSPHLLLQLLQVGSIVQEREKQDKEKKQKAEEAATAASSLLYHLPGTSSYLSNQFPYCQTLYHSTSAALIQDLFHTFHISSAHEAEAASEAFLAPQNTIQLLMQGSTSPSRNVSQLAFLSNGYREHTDPTIRIAKVTDHKSCGDALNIFTRTSPLETDRPPLNAKSAQAFERQEVPLKALQQLAGTLDAEGKPNAASREKAHRDNCEKAQKAAEIKQELDARTAALKAAMQQKSSEALHANQIANLKQLESLAKESEHQAASFKTAANKVLILEEITDYFKGKNDRPLSTTLPVLEPISENKKPAYIKHLQSRINIMSEKLSDSAQEELQYPDSEASKILSTFIELSLALEAPNSMEKDNCQATHQSLDELVALRPELGINKHTSSPLMSSKNVDKILEDIKNNLSPIPKFPAGQHSMDAPSTALSDVPPLSASKSFQVLQ